MTKFVGFMTQVGDYIIANPVRTVVWFLVTVFGVWFVTFLIRCIKNCFRN